MNPKLEKTTEFVRRNDIVAKLHAAVEKTDIGKMWTPFIGLEDGSCTLEVHYDGVNVSFRAPYTGVPGFETIEPTVGGIPGDDLDVVELSEPTITTPPEGGGDEKTEGDAEAEAPEEEDKAEAPEPGKAEEKGSKKKKRS